MTNVVFSCVEYDPVKAKLVADSDKEEFERQRDSNYRVYGQEEVVAVISHDENDLAGLLAAAFNKGIEYGAQQKEDQMISDARERDEF